MEATINNTINRLSKRLNLKIKKIIIPIVINRPLRELANKTARVKNNAKKRFRKKRM